MKLFTQESRNFWLGYAHIARHMGLFDAAVRATERAMSGRVDAVLGDNGETISAEMIDALLIATFGPTVKS